MNVVANPLVVAVALGLLGPGALEEDAEPSVLSVTDNKVDPLDQPSWEEQERVAALFASLRAVVPVAELPQGA